MFAAVWLSSRVIEKDALPAFPNDLQHWFRVRVNLAYGKNVMRHVAAFNMVSHRQLNYKDVAGNNSITRNKEVYGPEDAKVRDGAVPRQCQNNRD